MIETPPAGLDLEQLRQSIEQEAARTRAQALAVRCVEASPPGHWCFNGLEARDRLRTLAELAQAGTPPRLDRADGLHRLLGGLLSRLVLRLGGFILSRQTDYNGELLNLLRYLAEALHDMETRVVQQQEQIRHLEHCLAQLRSRALARRAS